MNLDLDLANFNGGGGMPMECNNMRPMPEKRSKTYDDPARMFQAPEKRARFERTADMLARSGLLDITMKTAELLRSNQQARQELVQLKQEIDEFTRSVLANPENQSGSLRPAARTLFTANPLSGDLEIPASPKVSVIKSHSTVGGQM